MKTFNPDSDADIHVESTDDSFKIRVGEATLGFNATADGFSVTNDWNNRHFTLGVTENSVLYHLTRDDLDDRDSGQGNLAPEEFVAEIYSYLRSIAHPVPAKHLDLDFVGAVDFVELRTYLEDYGVVNDSDRGLRVDGEKKSELESLLNEDGTALGELYQRVLDPVEFDEAISENDDSQVFAYPVEDEIYVLVPYPDEYIGLTTVRNVMRFASVAGGSQVMDHLIRAMSDE